MQASQPKKVIWIGSSRKDIKAFPEEIRDDFGVGLYYAQLGAIHPDSKPLKGLGAGVAELVADDRSGTYRAVYTVALGDFIYVLHCFQKKSKTGIKTSQRDIDLIKTRLKDATANFRQRGGKGR
jgi:phage-related protein